VLIGTELAVLNPVAVAVTYDDDPYVTPGKRLVPLKVAVAVPDNIVSSADPTTVAGRYG